MKEIMIGEYYTLALPNKFYILKALGNGFYDYFEEKYERFKTNHALYLKFHVDKIEIATDFYRNHLDNCIIANKFIDLPKFDNTNNSFSLEEILQKLKL